MKRFAFGIRARLAFLVLVATVPLLAVDAYTAWVLHRVQETGVRADLDQLARAASDRLKSAVEGSEQLLSSLAHVSGVVLGNAAECKAVFDAILAKSRRYTSFIVTDAVGDVLCDSTGRAAPINLADRPYFQRARTTGRFLIGDVVVGRLTNKPVMTLAYPFVANGEFRGALVTGLDLQWFGKQFDDSRPDLNLIFTLWNGDGTILYRYPESEKWIGKRVTETEIGKAVASRRVESLFVDAIGVTGVPTLYAVKGQEGWSGIPLSLSVGVAKAELHPEANSVLFHSVIVFGFAFVVTLLVAWLIAEGGIRQPVKALSSAAMRLASGQFGARTELPGGEDELGQLGVAFDTMAASLEADHERIVQSAKSLARANRALQVLSECNSALIRARGETTLLEDMCRIVVKSGGYRMAWVGYAEADDAKSIRPVAQAGYEVGYLESLHLTWADREGDRSLMGTAIRTGAPLVARNIPMNPDCIAFRASALERGYAASIGLPLKSNEKVLGAFAINAAEPDALDDREVELLLQLANDLAFGIQALRNKAELDRHRNQLEEILRERNEGYGMVLRTAMDGFWVIDPRGRFLEVNDSYCNLIGYSREELAAMSIADIEAAESQEQITAHIQEFTHRGPARFITRHRRKDGSVLDVEVSANYLPLHGGRLFIFVHDVTEQLRMQEALRNSKQWVEAELARRSAELGQAEQRFRLVAAAIEQAPVAVMITDSARKIDYVNPGFTRITGYAPEEALGRNPRLLMSEQQNLEKSGELWTTVLAGLPWRGELISRRKDDSEYVQDLTVSPVRDPEGKIVHFVAVALDVTERRRAEGSLRESEDRYRDLVENSGDLICTHDLEGRLLSVNAAASKALGYQREALLARNLREILTPGTREHFSEYLAELQATGYANGVMAVHTASGDIRYWEFRNSLRREGLSVPIVRGMARDVTDRQRMATALNESEAKFRALVEQSLVGIFMIDAEGVRYTNPRADEIFGYAHGELACGSLKPLIAEEDWPAAERAIRALISGEKPIAGLDLRGRRKDGSEVLIGAQGLRSRHDRGAPIVIGVMQDITDKKHAEEQIERYVAQLEAAVMRTAEVATTMSEMRDPYTAGHARRVAEIAVAIGAELGYDEGAQKGLRVACALHDVGKVTIPAEILSKPGRLSPLEMALMRGHAQAGYEILKNVEFPWPVAQIALQHHERMDGSGYPQGLKGEEILMESRLVAVADVVEAMASHRPYRPGLGIEKALAEIERGRGSFYDPLAADACLRLFREKGYALPT